jgi:gas vesicle protein GvpA/GvpJ/GvpM family
MNEQPGPGSGEQRRRIASARRERVLAQSRARRDASLARQAANRRRSTPIREAALIDLIERLLDGGVVIHGDITLAVADVDLLYVGLRALVASVETMEQGLGIPVSARGASLDASAL